MPAFICTACGTQYAPSQAPPPRCTICEDNRQYEPGIVAIGPEPHFAIGQRALLVCTAQGNVLWDTIAMLDAATVTLIRGLGGVAAIGISPPHFYTTMGEW